MKVSKNIYSEKSYEELMAIVKEAQALTDQTLYNEYCQKITKAKTSLVNIEVLSEKVEKLEAIDSSAYTKASYKRISGKVD